MSVKQLLRKHSSEQSEHYFFCISFESQMPYEPWTRDKPPTVQFTKEYKRSQHEQVVWVWCFYLVQESCLFESEPDTRVPFKCFISLSTGCPEKPILLLFTIDTCQICSKDILVDTLQFSKQKTVFPHLLKWLIKRLMVLILINKKLFLWSNLWLLV